VGSSGTLEPSTSALAAGTWYLLPTPFDASGALDLASQRTIVEAAIAWGVDGLTVMGVMSEPTTLTGDERHAALEAIFETVAGRVPVVVGSSGSSRSIVLGHIAEARALGAVAAMVAAPTLLRNVDLLPDFFGSLRRDGGLPLLLQDEPAATGVTIPVSVLLACATAARTRSIKVEDPPTPSKIGKLRSVDPSLVLFGGLGGVAALGEMRRGAAGTMTGFAYPEVMRAIRLGLERGQDAGAAALFDRFLPLIVFEAQVQVGLLVRKEVLRRRGAIRHGFTRGLVNRIDQATADELDDILARVQVTPSIEALSLPAVAPGA
jgi:4-hydroxy-tetrahydrodipicolinate synthase